MYNKSERQTIHVPQNLDMQTVAVKNVTTIDIQTGSSPYIGTNGTWWEYDDEQKKFVDTLVIAIGKNGTDGTNGTDGNDGVQGIQGIQGDNGESGTDGTNGIDGEDGAQGIPGKDGAGTSIYDKVIRTQEEFNTLVASPTWLGAKSVCFIGDCGTLKFTRATTGYKIPQTVKNIKGLNDAILEVTAFVYNETTNKGVLWYATLPTTGEYSIDGIAVVHTADGFGFSFFQCTNLTNCISTGTVTSTIDSTGSFGFHVCTNLTNCISTGTGEIDCFSFSTCTHLINCTGTTTVNSGFNFSFNLCKKLINCTGYANGATSVGYHTCTQLTNCSGSGSSPSGYGVGFHSCSYLNGCNQGERASSTEFLGGPNTKVDTQTVVAN